ncbi:acetyltransferase (GNAT) family protein [Herbihabitans rhizosphaerae]|uniref:Acetyltransferase (GNAT) family protein n=1 Tax=Herbihabitans rhizosphaerae TaxID=1872711 RepID=A0A4V2ERK3_9PSEU|nr:GNAT family N-acetyltransferase [Herbihabitans rhizosphaerae]RZS32249.1 acetyltransferase (GNAT) family protein [Herbihabitans rhizosphaerae]
MPDSLDAVVRIAAAQLIGVGKDRDVVPAGPFTGLLVRDRPAFLSYAVAASPGAPVDGDVTESLATLTAAFSPAPVRFELIDEASPGAVDVLTSAGARVVGRYPLLTLDVAEMVEPVVPQGVDVHRATTKQHAIDGQTVVNAAYGATMDENPDAPGDPVDGGCVLATVDGRPAATAFWTPVVDGVTEVAGVGTVPEFRNRGLGTLVSAHAVREAATAGATLVWLTPGDDGADRIYRRIGFSPTANAVHLESN